MLTTNAQDVMANNDNCCSLIYVYPSCSFYFSAFAGLHRDERRMRVLFAFPREHGPPGYATSTDSVLKLLVGEFDLFQACWGNMSCCSNKCVETLSLQKIPRRENNV